MRKRLNDYAVQHLEHPEEGQIDVWDVKRIAMWTPDRRPILTPRSPEVVSV